METELVKRLEVAVQRLENFVLTYGDNKASNNQSPLICVEIEEKLNELKLNWIPLCKKIGSDVEAAGNELVIYYQRISWLLAAPETCKATTPEELMAGSQKLLNPLKTIQETINTAFKQRSPNEQLLKAIQASLDINKSLFVPAPIDYFKEVIGQVEYYNNRVRMLQNIPDAKQWANTLTGFLRSIQTIMEERLGNHKLIFKGKLTLDEFLNQNYQCGQENLKTDQQSAKQPEIVLKKEETKPQAKTNEVKQPKKEYKPERKLHIYENINNETIDLEIKMFESVQVFNCTGLTLNIIGKANSINILQCSGCLFKVQSVVSAFELLRSPKCNVQITQHCPTMSLENSSEAKIYLSNSALDADITMSCCSDVKVIEIEHENEREHVLPTHFSYKLKDGKLEVKEVDMGFE